MCYINKCDLTQKVEIWQILGLAWPCALAVLETPVALLCGKPVFPAVRTSSPYEGHLRRGHVCCIYTQHDVRV